MRKVKLADATQAEMLNYCLVTLGMPKAQVPTHTGVENLRGKILSVMGPETDEITVPDLETPIAPKEVRPQHGGTVGLTQRNSGLPTAAHGLNDPKVEITIFKTEKNKGEPIQVSVNGRLMLVPVGSRVVIPYRYYLALQNAQTTQYDFNEKTNDIDPREESRHPFNVHHLPSDEEIAAWDTALLGDQQNAA